MQTAHEILTVTIFLVTTTEGYRTFYDRTLAEEVLREVRQVCPEARLSTHELHYHSNRQADMANYEAHLRAAAVETARRQA